jgi:tetratricopeptide (TPR) repeat protein
LISFRHLEKSLPAAGDLLRLSSFFAPDSIPLGLFRDGAQSLPSSLAKIILEPLTLMEARSALRRYSLVDVTAESFSIHRLVQVVVIDRLDDITKRFWAEVALKVVYSCFVVRKEKGGDLISLLPHALSVAQHAEKGRVDGETTADLLEALGVLLSKQGLLPDSRSCFERALAVAEQSSNIDKQKIARILNNIGSVVRSLGDFQLAIEYHERGLTLDLSCYSEADQIIALDFYNLGLALFDSGQEIRAKELFSKAISILETSLGESHQATMLLRENIASLVDGQDWQAP